MTRELKNRRQSSSSLMCRWWANHIQVDCSRQPTRNGFGHWICVDREKPRHDYVEQRRALSVASSIERNVSSIKLTSRFANLNKILLASWKQYITVTMQRFFRPFFFSQFSHAACFTVYRTMFFLKKNFFWIEFNYSPNILPTAPMQP